MKSRIFIFLAFGLVAVGLAGLVACSSETEATTAAMKLPTLRCGSCSNTVEKVLQKVGGVKSVDVDLKKKTAKVTFDAKVTNVPALEQAVVMSGYQANDKKSDPKAYEKLSDCCKVSGH